MLEADQRPHPDTGTAGDDELLDQRQHGDRRRRQEAAAAARRCPTTRGGRWLTGTFTSPARVVGSAVTGTRAGPRPSAARAASSRTPSTSAAARRRMSHGGRGPIEPVAQGRARRFAGGGRGRRARPARCTVRPASSCDAGTASTSSSSNSGSLEQIGIVDGQREHGGVERAGEQLGEQGRRGRGRDHQPHPGVLGPQAIEEAGEQPPGRGRDDADAGLAGRRRRRGRSGRSAGPPAHPAPAGRGPRRAGRPP